MGVGTLLLYEIITSWGLISLGIYHIFSTTKNHLKSPRDYFAKPYHPLTLSPSYHYSRILRPIQLYLITLFFIIALIHTLIVSSESDPLLQGRTPVHFITSLQSASVIFLFLLLTVSLLISESTTLLPVPLDLYFALLSAVFYLRYSVLFSTSGLLGPLSLLSHCDAISGNISLLTSVLSITLAVFPRLFIADIGLGASMVLQGLWTLQTGLSLHVDVFIPEGCHKLLDVVSGVEGSTKCDLEDSKIRAVAILDLVFVVHVMFVVVIVMVIYAAIARTLMGTSTNRRFGTYEPLPTTIVASSAGVSASSGSGGADVNHIQMKAMAGTQA